MLLMSLVLHGSSGSGGEWTFWTPPSADTFSMIWREISVPALGADLPLLDDKSSSFDSSGEILVYKKHKKWIRFVKSWGYDKCCIENSYLLFLPVRYPFFVLFFDLAFSDVDSLSAELFLISINHDDNVFFYKTRTMIINVLLSYYLYHHVTTISM